MSNVIPLRNFTVSDCQGSTTQGLSIPELRAVAWSNFYAAERRDGTVPDLAAQRADYFVTKRFEGLIADITNIMAERR